MVIRRSYDCLISQQDFSYWYYNIFIYQIIVTAITHMYPPKKVEINEHSAVTLMAIEYDLGNGLVLILL